LHRPVELAGLIGDWDPGSQHVARTAVFATSSTTIVISTIHAEINCSHIGKTATALVASVKIQKTARRVAVANLCFNTLGALLFLPWAGWFVQEADDAGIGTDLLDSCAQILR
jgi:Na+/phosphate symporter